MGATCRRILQGLDSDQGLAIFANYAAVDEYPNQLPKVKARIGIEDSVSTFC